MKNNLKIDYKESFKYYLFLYIWAVIFLAIIIVDRYTEMINIFWIGDKNMLPELLKFQANYQQGKFDNSNPETLQEVMNVGSMIFLIFFFLYTLSFTLISWIFITFNSVISSITHKSTTLQSSINKHDIVKRAALLSLLTPLLTGILFPVVFAMMFKRQINSLRVNGIPAKHIQSSIFFWGTVMLAIIAPNFFATMIAKEKWQILIATALISLAVIPFFISMIIKWLTMVKVDNYFYYSEFKLRDSIGFFLQHLLLTIFTLGIYYPIFISKTWEYGCYHIIKRSFTGEKEYNIISTEINHKEGFILFWKNALISIATLGIYLPILINKRITWLINSTTIEKARNQTEYSV